MCSEEQRKVIYKVRNKALLGLLLENNQRWWWNPLVWCLMRVTSTTHILVILSIKSILSGSRFDSLKNIILYFSSNSSCSWMQVLDARKFTSYNESFLHQPFPTSSYLKLIWWKPIACTQESAKVSWSSHGGKCVYYYKVLMLETPSINAK